MEMKRLISKHNHHKPIDKNSHNYILSTYFTKDRRFNQHDSSCGAGPNNFNVISKWYNSIVKLNLNAIIFHNECSDEFIERYQTDKIKFVYYNEFNRISYNDERFYCYKEYLNNNENIKRVVFTDLFDVEFFKNPFEFMDKNKYNLYVGSELAQFSKWFINNQINSCNFEKLKSNELYYNVGILGGEAKDMKIYLDVMVDIYNKNKSNVIDMAVNIETIRILKNSFKFKIFTGRPFHTEFSKFEYSNHTNSYIRHK